MKKRKIFRFVISMAGIFLTAVLILLTIIILKAPTLNEESVTPDGYLTTLLDDEGNTMRTIYGVEANRVYVTLDDIPENVQNAFIAIEDSRFYSHHGIDIRGIGRALKKGITTGTFSEGASTITQQLLKNNLFTDWMNENTFFERASRKVQEQYLALRLEQKESKEWILENYLNTINLGGGAWGVQSASWLYFNKDVSELTLSESAVIAGITKNPSAYNPLKDPDKCRSRQELVLAAMRDQGYITEDQYQEALADDVFTRIAENHNDVSTTAYSYFEDSLLTEICDDLETQYGYTEEQAWEIIYRGGLTIYSTEDPDIQKICESTVNNDSYYSGNEQVSVVMMDTETGAVRAIVGGRGEKTASLTYNRATDSVRQPGSTIKIIGEYAAGLDSGVFTLGTAFDDAPTCYSDGTSISNADGNFDGMITVRQAIIDSTNTVALNCFQTVGINSVMNELKAFGITTLDSSDAYESLALGGTHNGVTNLELTAAYNTIANDGTYIKPYFYTEVYDHDGNLLLSNQASGTQIIKSSTAALLTSAMEDVMTEGTGTRANFYGMSLAGKSGTTTDKKDLWFVGYSPYYTCGVWGGFDDDTAQSSSNYVKLIWKNIMSQVHSNYLYKDFSGTDGLVKATICTKCGNLAVNGLCDNTIQGDMTCTEYFAEGTEPTTSCTCHQTITLCDESGMQAGNYCPETTSTVYLRSGTAGTADEDAVYTGDTEQTCTTHTEFWDSWDIWDIFEGSEEDSESPHSDSDPDNDRDSSEEENNSLWDWFDTEPSENGGSYFRFN